MDPRARKPFAGSADGGTARKRTVVTRPEPPSDEPPVDQDAPPRRPALSREEVQALLAVTKTNRPPLGRVLRRAGLGLVPMTILGVALDTWVGWWATPVLLVLLAVWAAWPMLRQDRDGWT